LEFEIAIIWPIVTAANEIAAELKQLQIEVISITICLS